MENSIILILIVTRNRDYNKDNMIKDLYNEEDVSDKKDTNAGLLTHSKTNYSYNLNDETPQDVDEPQGNNPAK